MRRGRPPYPDLLTPREQEVLSLIRECLTNQEIADRLGISESGARYHVSEILGKLGVASRAEAAAWREEQPAPSRRFGFALPFFGLKGVKLAQAAVIAVAAVAFALLALGVLLSSNDTAPEDSAAAPDPTPSPEVDDLTALIGPQHQLAAVRDDNSVVVIELESMRETVIIPAGECGVSVTELLWSPSGDLLLCRGISSMPPSHDDYVMLLVEADGTVVDRRTGWVPAPRWAPDQDRLAFVTVSQGPDLTTWHGDLFVLDASGNLLALDSGVYWRVAWSEDGTRLAAARTDGTIAFYDAGLGLVENIPVAAMGVQDWAVDDSRLLTVASFEPDPRHHAVGLLSLETNAFIEIGEDRAFPPRQYWLSPDRNIAIVPGEAWHQDGGGGFELHILNLEDGTSAIIAGSRISRPSDSLHPDQVRFSPDGSKVQWASFPEGQPWEADLRSLAIRQLSSHWPCSPDMLLATWDGSYAGTVWIVPCADGRGFIDLGSVRLPAWRPR